MNPVGPRAFACSCGDEAKAECAEVMDWALGYLSQPKYPVTRENLLTQVVYQLAGWYEASIDSIPCDPGGWCAVEASTWTPKGGDPEFRTAIQCDRVENGIAYTLRAFYEKYGERRVIEGEDDDAD